MSDETKSNTDNNNGDSSENKTKAKLTYREVKACQFQSWYKTFRKSKNNPIENSTPRSIIIPLSHEFITYLLSDGVKLPIEACDESDEDDGSWTDDPPTTTDNDHDSDGRDDGGESEEEEVSFPELTNKITKTISDLDGSVFPKLNWSSPKDAAWMNTEGMKCKTAGDVYLLLKSSDFIVHDLVHAWDDLSYDSSSSQEESIPKEYNLVLRKWCNLHKSMEYRCFISDHEIIGISQRDHTQFYPYLDADKHKMKSLIDNFFHEVVQYKFGEGDDCISNYVLDCYIDKNDRVWIIDFNVWDERTDPLLFSWEELNNIRKQQQQNSDTVLEFRLVTGEKDVKQDPLSSYRAPIDTVDLASDTWGAESFFKEFMSKCEKPSDLFSTKK